MYAANELAIEANLTTLRVDPAAAARQRLARGRTGKITKLRPGETNPVFAALANRRYATNYVRAIHGKHEQEREELMAIYITQGRYTPDAVKGMVANPERGPHGKGGSQAPCPLFHIRRV